MSRHVVEVANPMAQTAHVTIYHARIGGELDTVIWAYNSLFPPGSDAALLACDFGVGDSCTGDLASNPCGNTGNIVNFAALENVVIPPNGKILVYSALKNQVRNDTFAFKVLTVSVE